MKLGLRLAFGLLLSTAAAAQDVPDMRGPGGALKFPVIDHRTMPWDDLGEEQKNAISHRLVSLDLYMRFRTGALIVEECRRAGPEIAARLADEHASAEKRAARFIEKGREIAAAGLSAQELHGAPLPAARIRQLIEAEERELRKSYARRTDPGELATHCRMVMLYEALVSDVFPLSPERRR